ncbi:MAG TPA: DUF4388 domain-containing protein [Longimicrobiaceae bacterium]|nr:DUF4388 domain-containing protein [Longimicrobiaceae bacterium]
MAIEGPLHELALSDVFQLLDLSRKTGVLTVRGGGREEPAVVRFEKGAVVGAEYPGNSRRLGYLLLRAGKATQVDLDRAAAEQLANPGRAFGAILVDQGSATETDVRVQLRFQIEETVFELIRWKDGYFRFDETPPMAGDAVPISLATESLLMEAARRIDEWTTLETKITDMDLIPRLVAADPENSPVLDLRPDEWEVLAEVGGERTLETIARDLGRGDFEIAKTAFALLSTGIIEVAHAVPEEQDDSSQFMAGGTEISSAGKSFERGRIHARAGRWPAAHESLVLATQQDPLMGAAHYHLGFAAARIGDLAAAEAAWRTYLRLGESEGHRQEIAFRAERAAAALRRLLEQEGP